MTTVIYGAVEGDVDEVLLRRLISHVGAIPGPIHGKNGKSWLKKQINGYNQASRLNPWVVLADLDQDFDCAPALLSNWLLNKSATLCFRIAVREVESWLMADRERLSNFLSISKDLIPLSPEIIQNPKKKMVEISKRSRRRAIREDMAPRSGSGRQVGPAYASRLIEFIQDTKYGWRPNIASKSARSLDSCLRCLDQLIPRS